MNNVIWLHEDCLNMSHPLFKAAGQGAQTVFIWDAAYFKKMNYSFKKLVFLAETLAELPITVYSGDTVEVIKQLNPDHLLTPATPNPELQATVKLLSQQLAVKIVEDVAFVELDKNKVFDRFFPFGKKLRKN